MSDLGSMCVKVPKPIDGFGRCSIAPTRRCKTGDANGNISIKLLVDPAQIPEADVITREQIAILRNMPGMLNTDVREMPVLRFITAVYLGVNENRVET
jgi:hypothetical protein